MKKLHLYSVLLPSLFACMLAVAQAQQADEVASNGLVGTVPLQTTRITAKSPGGLIFTPPSSIPPHVQGTTSKTRINQTDIQIYVPSGWKADEAEPPSPYYTPVPPYVGKGFETPASIACIYALNTPVTGCNPNTVTTPPTGGSKSIAIVDAFDDPFIGPDLAYFSAQFGLPFNPTQLQIYYEDGTLPQLDNTGGWEVEESLDVEWAHAMAPNATIYLVEAQSPTDYDLYIAVKMAANLVRCGKTMQNPDTSVGTCPSGSTGTGEVSMSWGHSEISTESLNDSAMTTTGVVYVAAAGDAPGTNYPCTSPNVVCAGGTTIRRNPNLTTFPFINEVSWDKTGGGLSMFETIPSYQSSISSIVGKSRGVPDVALDSNPVTGLWVYDSFGYLFYPYDEMLATNVGWLIVGGTSAASPMWAGILNNAAGRTGGSFAASSNAELTKMYANKAVAADFRDITLGFCGPYDGFSTATGWDPCTGIGSNQGFAGK